MFAVYEELGECDYKTLENQFLFVFGCSRGLLAPVEYF